MMHLTGELVGKAESVEGAVDVVSAGIDEVGFAQIS
jgi:hypothetical protein